MTTGVTPFRGESMMELLMRHFNDTPTPPILINPELPQAVSDVILKSIAKEPEERFSSASAMTIALAEAFNVPIPPELQRISSISIATHGQKVRNPISLPGIVIADPTVSFETYPVQPSVLSLPLTPPPVNVTSAVNGNVAFSARGSQTVPPQQVPVAPLPVPQSIRKRPGKKFYRLASIVLLLVLGVGVVSYVLWSTHKTPTASVPVFPTHIGQVLFANSPNTIGALDEAQLTLQGIHDAPTGKSYYAWLATHDDSIELVHWPLTVHNGTLTSTTYVNAQHQNLLTASPYLFLITLQSDTPSVPSVPSFDSNDDLYYAVIPQTPATADNYSVVDHLNHLLTSDPSLEKLGMPNGLRYWLVANTKALLQEVNSANDARQNKDSLALRQHLVNILYYLRGTSCAPSDLRGVPQGTPITPDFAIAPNVKASLLNCERSTNLSSLLVHSELHVRGIIQAPGSTPTQVSLAPHLIDNLDQVTAWLDSLYQNDILHLITLSDDQLLQASAQSFFDDMRTSAQKAYNGSTPSAKLGVVQFSNDVQHLPTFDIQLCPRNSANNICTS